MPQKSENPRRSPADAGSHGLRELGWKAMARVSVAAVKVATA